MIESVVLNPDAFTTAYEELDLHSLGLEVGKEGVDWGEAQVAIQLSRQQIGATVTDTHIEPVEISIPLVAMDEGETSLAEAIYRLQQGVGLLQADEYDPRWIGRTFSTAGGFDGQVGYLIHSASLTGVQGRAMAHNNVAPDIVLKALRSPFCYADVEVESEEFSGTAARHLIFELEELYGTHPGLIRTRVTNDDATDDWNGLIAAYECRDHPQDATADTTAALHYAAEDLTLRGGATVKEGTVEASLTAGWLTFLNSEIEGVGHMTHRGVRDIWIRAEDLGEDPGDVELRLRSRSLGTLRWTEHDSIPSPLVDDEQVVYLGQVRPQRAALGDERVEYEIQARATSGSGKARVRDLYLLPDESCQVLSSPGTTQAADAQSTKSPGTVADDSGTGSVSWTNPGNAKASDDSRATVDLELGQTSHYLKATNFGFALPEAATPIGIIVTVERHGEEPAEIFDAAVRIVKGGVIQSAQNKASLTPWPASDATESYGAADDPWGQTWAYSDVNSSNFGVAIAAKHTVAVIKREALIDSVSITVYYTEAADENRICFATRSVELRTNGCFRQLIEDDVWGELISEGRNPFAPVAGLEGRKARFIVIPTQGDLGEAPDAGTNDLTAQVFMRPAYLFAPGAG